MSLVWIPSHIGVDGNERADLLAGSAVGNPLAERVTFELSASEKIARFRQEWIATYLSTLHLCLKPTALCREAPTIYPWQFSKVRTLSIALHRLRSGHNLLRYQRSRINVEVDPGCRFGCLAIEDADHIVIHCPYFQLERQKLAAYCLRRGIELTLSNVLGCCPSLSRPTQFQLRDLVIKFIVDSGFTHFL